VSTHSALGGVLPPPADGGWPRKCKRFKVGLAPIKRRGVGESYTICISTSTGGIQPHAFQIGGKELKDEKK
jgi:hypothetical protein